MEHRCLAQFLESDVMRSRAMVNRLNALSKGLLFLHNTGKRIPLEALLVHILQDISHFIKVSCHDYRWP